MELNSLRYKVKSKKMRVGRGIGSGKGKTSGRGHKGQKSRRGVSIKSFEGGQMPLYRRLPKRGFISFKKKKIALINLDKLQKLYDSKKITNNTIINISELKKNNLLKKKDTKIKVLGNGDLKNKLKLEVDFISKAAKKKIEDVGGSVVVKAK
jgi:large subunit ribosomal protein L15